MQALKLPQLTNSITKHYRVPGMYCRTLWRAANSGIIGKVHRKQHFFICAMGEIHVASGEHTVVMHPGDVLECLPGTRRATWCPVDSIGITVHQTEKESLEEIEDDLVVQDSRSPFGAGNKLEDEQICHS